MCGRYYIDEHDPLLRSFVDAARLKGEVKTGEVFPSDCAAVIANNRRLTPSVFPMRWGFERPNAKLRRCLIPASWYYEWERRAGSKVKYALRSERGGVVYLGGLYTLSKDGAPRFTVLTRDAAPGIAFIHNRMPVIVPPEKQDAWLSQQFTLDELLGDAETDMEYKPEE